MRILHLTTFLQGGAGLAITSLATTQAREGHRVGLLTSRTGVPGYGNYPAHLEALASAGVEVAALDSLFDRRPDAHTAVEEYLDGQLGRAGGFDILHTHAAVPSALALAAVRRSGRSVPVLQTMHGWGLAKTPSQADADVQVLNRVTRVVVPAQASAELLGSLGVERRHLSVVPYGVAPAALRAVNDTHLQRMRMWRCRGELVMCCIGTLGERKNQTLLLEALALLSPGVTAQAVFVGDGPAEPLQERAAALGVADRVHVVGYRPDARRFLRESHVLVLPSRSEGQPLTVLEAFCDGVPVLASRIPELAELIDDGRTGWLFDAEDAGALAGALAYAARAPGIARAVTARARASYEERFTIDRMVAGYMQEYQRAS